MKIIEEEVNIETVVTGRDSPAYRAEKAVHIDWNRWNCAPKNTNIAPPTAPTRPPVAPSPPKPTAADTSPIIENGRRIRWRQRDELGCRRCKRCNGPFVWAQVIDDTDPKAKHGAWMKLDPDLMPHGCGGPRAGRFIDPEPKPTDGATTHDDN